MKVIFFILSFLFLSSSFAASKKYFEKKTYYRTFFGQCPSKIVGRLTLSLIKEFEKNKSLLDVKKKIIKEKLEDKYYLSSYKVDYNPLKNLIKFQYDCPLPLMKVQIYKNDGEEFYTAVLVDNGKLFDPTYEVLMRADKQLKGDLPNLAIPASLLNTGMHMKITSVLNDLKPKFVNKISEMILNENKELTMILSIGRKPSSVFLGKDQWAAKAYKLTEIVEYMSKKKTIPAVINLTNSKKVIVKFSDKI